MVTSSSPLAGYASIGAGIPPYAITDVITVVKAYSSAVGAGPFVSEIFGDEAEELRRRGGDNSARHHLSVSLVASEKAQTSAARQTSITFITLS